MLRLMPRPDEELDGRNPLVLMLPHLVDAETCARLIGIIERLGPAPAPITTAAGFVMRPDIRNNDRVMFDDTALAAQLFERVRPHLPERLEVDWRICATNERFRCYRYQPGQYFAPHYDGAFQRNPRERSLLTMLVYLNACEAGGSTRFLDLDLEVEPQPGAALLFNHFLLHEGAPVVKGTKYVLRTDVMYRV
jgi:predicted 2-oxoglutarate/Fe(II)-dependent dioxygenase YbiX